ncbi:MAG: hypothetical protein MRQ07_02980 [Candidatus Midichloria sp.]|nr:hypothetical protein [Candidatus Midichloria sp.]
MFAIFALVGGILSDRIGIKRVMIAPGVLFLLSSYNLFELIQYSSYSLLFPLISQGIMAILMGLFFGAFPAALITIFPLHVRFSGISLAYNMSMAIFGGTTLL